MKDITASLSDYPNHEPVDWFVSYGGSTVTIHVQSWHSARALGAAELGVDESLVIVTRDVGPTVPDVTPKQGEVEVEDVTPAGERVA